MYVFVSATYCPVIDSVVTKSVVKRFDLLNIVDFIFRLWRP